MRRLHLVILLATSSIAASLLLYAGFASQARNHDNLATAPSHHQGFEALFSFTSPGSLFPPSAIISLTDDNSTFFLARPAAFGPALPHNGLSSPLWAGSGFRDEEEGREELGCGDHSEQTSHEHGQIQDAVVLLKRGGCGFLAKVLWAQDRGARAVIVGDDVRGGGLVRMYAKGDTSNVTIPSLFTSYTTAHLLSSLIPQVATEDAASFQASPSSKDLWVTLSPTNISTSPFFDTLLVLVVSPLVTLTVVYALLLLRSRIRRRRWRAPKSLVERLPVRTYQAIDSTSSSMTSNSSSPASPLLQRQSPQTQPLLSGSNAEVDAEAAAGSGASAQNVRSREEEKRETGLAEWRRRYGGRQRECVICLDDYVAGVSQVMSLPCGHEFHVDCITPWLVTRRRTCPICKGDVVRSLAQSFHERAPPPLSSYSSSSVTNEEPSQDEGSIRQLAESAASPAADIPSTAPTRGPDRIDRFAGD